MLIDKYIQDITRYAQDNIPVAVAAGAVLLFLLYRKPKIVFILALIVIGTAGVMELFDMLEGIGLARGR